MKLNILYFSRMREMLGRDGELVDVPATVQTVADLIGWLQARGEAIDAFRDPSRLRCAVDARFVSLATPLSGAREVAISPPVTVR